MNKAETERLVETTFNKPYDEGRFRVFVRNVFEGFAEKSEGILSGNMIWDAFKGSVTQYKRLGKYDDPEGYTVDILAVKLKNAGTLERARTLQRNFVARYLNGGRGGALRDAALVAFYADGTPDWRFSLVRMDYALDPERNKVRKDFTPARRYSFLVGGNEKTHTARKQLAALLQGGSVTLGELERAFNIESVTKEFFEQYKRLFLELKDELDALEQHDPRIRAEFAAKSVDTATFAKRLLGQIVFLYFLQKKGWLGVGRNADGSLGSWGTGPKDFLRRLFDKQVAPYDNFFDELLEPLFYEALARERDESAFYSRFNCRIPFLNGGLFEPVGDYNWAETRVNLNNETFRQIFDTFDLYNFTVREDEPLDKEVAVDPEMLGKVFENLLEVKDRKSKGAFYTPREIVHYMCQESLINYLDTAVNTVTRPLSKQAPSQADLFGRPQTRQLPLTEEVYEERGPRADLAEFIRLGDAAQEHDAATAAKVRETDAYSFKVPESVRQHAEQLDEALTSIKICDPAIGSGAFPVGMMNEIVRARGALNPYIGTHGRAAYDFKRHAIQESIYGVDIEESAVDIAKLRLWLSLIVDEDDYGTIKPLPNLEYKISGGNSLLGVEEPLFNDQLLDELEDLKQRCFDETRPGQKSILQKQVKELTRRIVGSDEAFDFEVYFSQVFRQNGRRRKGGFDVVIANPPYIGEKGNKEIFRPVKERKLRNFYQGKMDYFYFFFHLALNLAKDKGQIAFITTNYYVTATGAPRLRRDFKERSIVRKLIDFNELRIFETAKGQHNMVTILSKGQDESYEAEAIVTAQTGTATSATLQAIMTGTDGETKFYRKAQARHKDGPELYIRLEASSNEDENSIHNVLDKIKSQSGFLGTFCRVNQGVVSGCDYVSGRNLEKVLNARNVENGDGIFVFNLLNRRDKEVAESFSDPEKRLLRPFFKNSDIHKYWCETKPSKLLLYLAPASPPLENYPNVQAHMNRFKTILEDRREVKNEKIRYFELQWPRREHIFSGPKILVPYRTKTNSFAYNDIEWFCRSDAYVITSRRSDIQLKYVLALLNSSLYYKWLYYRGKRKGETLELFTAPINEIPIKKVSTEAQKPFIGIADQILSVTASSDYLTNAEKQAQVKAYERQIDALVYRLYDLTDEEIKIVEGSAS